MVPDIRAAFNRSFSREKYEQFLKDLHGHYPGAIDFRVAESPVFISKLFESKLYDACNAIIDRIIDPSFSALTERAIPPGERIPGTENPCQMLAFDFGVCESASGELEPQLIEMQGFPSLYGFQAFYPEVFRKHFDIPENYTHYLGGYDRKQFLADLQEILLNGQDPEEVILLEIKPHEQKTRIDFYCTRDYTGIKPVCLTQLTRKGSRLFYKDPDTGATKPIKRIYNRVIFDELNASRDQLGPVIDLTQPYEVEWVPHPNWFYRISKFTMPFIQHPFVPATQFLDRIKPLPEDLHNYVLKPLFSFAGQGVVIDITPDAIAQIKDPENWILQKKVQYASFIPTPDEPAKAEIRMLYLWNKGWERPRPAINLARLSKGKMIGVRYNKDKEWVGGSVAFFER
ncbi:MAG: hypothetical protein RL732_1019 [Bacteroidota bacterium]